MQLTKTLLLGLSIGLTILVSIVIIGTATWLFKKGKKGYSFVDLVRDADGWPSLARFQFLSWTIVILFSFTTIGLVMLIGGVLNAPADIPENLLMLMGISVAVTSTSAYISKWKYGEPAESGEGLSLEDIRKELREKKFETMLLENGRPGLSRFQMFSWTVVSIVLYFGRFFATLNGLDMNNISNIILPDVDFMMVMLMGLSQGAYVGGKWVSPTSVRIDSINPEKTKVGEIASIRGINFGPGKDTVQVDDKLIKPDDITHWDEGRIDFKVPKNEPGEHEVKVLVGMKKAAIKLNIEIT